MKTNIKKIGIECEQLEGERFGVGHTLAQLLETVAKLPDINKKFKFILYFKKEIPDDNFLSSPIFEKKITKFPLLPTSFNIFYHIFLPFYYIKDRLNGFFFPSYMLPAFFFGNAIVVLTNDVYYETKTGNLPFKYRLSYKIFSWLAAKRAKKIMTISEFSKKELSKFYNIKPEKIFVNPWGLSEKFRVLEKNKKTINKIGEIKTKLNIKNDYIISIGQAFPRRHVKESMLAFEKIAFKFPDIQYLVACKDKYNPPILDKLSEQINKNIGREAIIRSEYLNLDDIACLFNFSKLLVYISSSEAMGLPPIEASACGTVSLVADNELTREMLSNNSFFVTNLNSIDDIAEAMQKALTDNEKKEEIISNNAVLLKKFSWQKTAEKLTDVFEQIF